MSRLIFACTSLTLAAFAAGCVENNADSGLVILRNVAPETSCSPDPTSSTFRSSGVIQVDATSGYIFTPVVRNDLVSLDGEPASAKSIFISGARVTIDFYDKTLFTEAEQTTLDTMGITRFVSPSSGAIEPDGGLATYTLEVVPTDLLALIAPKLVPTATDPTPSTVLDVGVQFFGSRSGDDVSSNTFRYPVEVCLGCVEQLLGACSALPSGEYNAGGVCNRLQDGLLDCCTDAAGNKVCPVPAMAPM